MMWDVAAGVIIGGGVLGLIAAGLAAADKEQLAVGYGALLAGLALAVWVVFFKAHHGV
jgi:hypothetical protein